LGFLHPNPQDLQIIKKRLKQKLLNNELWITDCGECFHIRISIAAFPKKKEVALEVIKKIFS
jgi:RNA binding exosome subunit